MSDLADLLEALMRNNNWSSLRDAESGLEALGIKISRQALSNILKRKGIVPSLDTLTKLSEAAGRPLWEVMGLAGIDLQLPKSASERARRLAAILEREPALFQTIEQLQELNEEDPEYVAGMIVGLEASITLRRGRGRRLPPGHTVA